MADEYDPEWVALKAVTGRPKPPDDVHAQREAFNAALTGVATMLPATDPGIHTHDEKVTEHVNVRVYKPPGSEGTNLPLIVFYHGGGWRAGTLDTEDHICRTVCGRVGCIVVSVEYRVWPFVEYPVQCEDCYLAYQWAYENREYLGADPKRYSIWGGSAGVPLALSVVVRLISSGQRDRVTGLVSMAAMMVHPDSVPEKYKHLHTSYIDNGGDVPIVTGARMLQAYEDTPGDALWRDEELFPLVNAPESLKQFPRACIINTGKEACRDDGAVLEAGLKDVGIPVRRDVLPALPHYFWCFPLEQGGARFQDTLVERVKWMVGSGS